MLLSDVVPIAALFLMRPAIVLTPFVVAAFMFAPIVAVRGSDRSGGNTTRAGGGALPNSTVQLATM